MTLKHLILAVTLVRFTLTAASADPLESGFLNPPDSAKPQTWWHWMNGNITKVGITADLEAMKQIGLGGATIVNVDCGIPPGPVKFMSPQWRDDFKFAMQEANRLGLDMTVENCAGWSSSGGPWNTAEHAMQHVVSSEVVVSGPTNFHAALPMPPVKLGFYRDIAVLAYPVSDADAKLMRNSSPVASASSETAEAAKIIDGNLESYIHLKPPTSGEPQYVQLAFPQPFAARTVNIIGGRGMPQCNGRILISDDGHDFRAVEKFAFGRYSSGAKMVLLGDEPMTARFWRVQFDSLGNRDKGKDIPVTEIRLDPRTSTANLGKKITMDISPWWGSVEVTSDRDASLDPAGAVQRRDMLDLTPKLTADGILTWQVPAGKWMVQRLGYTPTGAKNHPAPVEGTGLECDKLNSAALDAHWAGFMQRIIDDIGPLAGKTLTTSLIDSYEVGGQTWTRNFREEFEKRRGYDPLAYLPAITGCVVDNPAVTERFLWDFRRTIADLFADDYFGRFARLCHQHDMLSAVEPYPGPFESLQSGQSADVVLGEFWAGSSGHPSLKLISSIAHIYGKKIVAAESFTGPAKATRWQKDPYSLKTLGDLAYCQGVNRYIFHRYAMQPWTNRWPGMTMGKWGIHFERTATWWNEGKPWIDYITHCEYMLQQGRSVQDAAYFTGQSAPTLLRDADNPPLPAGYDYDGVNADVLLHGATVKDGRVTLASGANYAVLILPKDDPDMTPQMLRGIAKLVRAGATVLGAPPQHSPSLAGYPECDAQVKKLAAEMWGDCDGKEVLEHAYGQGRVVWGKAPGEIFAEQHLQPDFEFTGVAGDTQLLYTHRVTAEADIYFVSNQRREADVADCTFRVSGKTPELWHPDTGVIERAPIWHEADGSTTVRLKFGPADSVFVVFRSAASGTQVVSAKEDPQWQTFLDANGKLRVKATSAGKAIFMTANGKTLQATALDVPAPREISGPWTLNFPPNWGAPPSVTLNKLISWTDHPDKGVKYFSGTATYDKEIEIDAERLSAGRQLWLDLGAVKNFAEVSLNGRDFGVLWKPPFRVNVTSAAKPGGNKLEVKVTNLWPNRLIGDEQLPPDVQWEKGDNLKAWPQWLLDGKPSPTGRLTFTTWHLWKKTDALLESGLLGPVTLQTVQIISAK